MENTIDVRTLSGNKVAQIKHKYNGKTIEIACKHELVIIHVTYKGELIITHRNRR